MSICFILLNMAVVIKKYKKRSYLPLAQRGIKGVIFLSYPLLSSTLLFLHSPGTSPASQYQGVNPLSVACAFHQ